MHINATEEKQRGNAGKRTHAHVMIVSTYRGTKLGCRLGWNAVVHGAAVSTRDSVSKGCWYGVEVGVSLAFTRR